MHKFGYFLIVMIFVHSLVTEFRIRNLEAELMKRSSEQHKSLRSIELRNETGDPLIQMNPNGQGNIKLISPSKNCEIELSSQKGQLEVKYQGRSRISLGETDLGGYLQIYNLSEEGVVFISPDEIGRGNIALSKEIKGK